MGRLFRVLLVLAALAAAVVIGYAVFFELQPPSRDLVIPVQPTHA